MEHCDMEHTDPTNPADHADPPDAAGSAAATTRAAADPADTSNARQSTDPTDRTDPVDPAPRPPVDEVLPGEPDTLELQALAPAPSLPIYFLSDGARAAAAVAFIEVPLDKDTGGLTGTGVLVGPRALMTCQHVLPSDADVRRASFRFTYQEESGEQTRTRQRTYRADPAHAPWRSASLDCMVIVLESAVERHETSIALSIALPSNNERFHLIHHPLGRDKQLALNVPMQVVATNAVWYAPVGQDGSSGGPLCDSAWQMAVLHRGKQTFKDPTLFVGAPTRNVGIPLRDVWDEMPSAVRAQLNVPTDTPAPGSREDAATDTPAPGPPEGSSLQHMLRVPAPVRPAQYRRGTARASPLTLALSLCLAAVTIAALALVAATRGAVGQTTGARTVLPLRIATFRASPHPTGLVVGSDGNIWCVDGSVTPNVVGKMTPNGDFTPYGIPAGNVGIRVLVPGSDGALWFTQYFGNSIGRITTAGTFSPPRPVPNVAGPDSRPSDMVLGPDGNLWFSEIGAGKIGHLSPAGVITDWSVATPYPPGQLAFGPDGNVWFITSPPGDTKTNNHLYRFSPVSHTVVGEYTIPSVQWILNMRPGPDGNIWFTDVLGDQIGEIAPSGQVQLYQLLPKSEPWDLVVGPDKSIWFTEYTANLLGRIRPVNGIGARGVVSEFGPLPAAGPQSITSGPNNTIWIGLLAALGAFNPPAA